MHKPCDAWAKKNQKFDDFFYFFESLLFTGQTQEIQTNRETSK